MSGDLPVLVSMEVTDVTKQSHALHFLQFLGKHVVASVDGVKTEGICVKGGASVHQVSIIFGCNWTTIVPGT
jgi:hypothetical protein